MKQGINLGYVCYRRNSEEKRDFTEALALCRNAGFTEFDYLSSVLTDDYRETAHFCREALDRAGCTVHQSHCPFFRYQENGIRQFRKFAPRAVEAASVLGAKYLVIHADEYRPAGAYEPDDVFERNYDLMAPIVELCLKYGISPAFENLFEDHLSGPSERSRFCAEPEELLALVERFHDPRVGVCLDSGHAQCSRGKAHIGVLELLEKHLFCTHIHDNYYGGDLHLPAFFGTIDWERFMHRLSVSGYSGNFTWELVYGRFPDPLLPDYLAFLHRIGEYLLNMRTE